MPLGSIFGSVFDSYLTNMASQIDAKSIKNLCKPNAKIDTALDGFSVALGSVLEARLVPKSAKMQS